MRRRCVKLIAVTLPVAFLLAACGEEPAKEPAQSDGTASGEILQGSISDAMLPLDTVTSQSPPLKQSAPAESASDDENSGDDETGEAAETQTPEPGPETAAPAGDEAPEDN